MKTTALKIEISNDCECILIEASKLSLQDAFLKHEPRTEVEMKFKATLIKVIEIGVDDFYRPVMDPSISYEEKTKIQYIAGKIPAVGKSYNWWEEVIKDTEWSIGTKSQYIAFLGVLIKMLVTSGWTVDEAWYAVCIDSKKLGHYFNSDNSKQGLENTGSREICGFFDLANTYKVLAKDEEVEGFWASKTCWHNLSFFDPLVSLEVSDSYYCNNNVGIAWLVRNK